MASEPNPIDKGKLVTSLVEALASGNAMAMHFERMVQDQHLPEGAPAIQLLSGIKKILRELPDKAFSEPKHRLALVDAVQDALDTAIEAEEEALEQHGEGDDGDDAELDERMVAPQAQTQINPPAGGNN